MHHLATLCSCCTAASSRHSTNFPFHKQLAAVCAPKHRSPCCSGAHARPPSASSLLARTRSGPPLRSSAAAYSSSPCWTGRAVRLRCAAGRFGFCDARTAFVRLSAACPPPPRSSLVSRDPPATNIVTTTAARERTRTHLVHLGASNVLEHLHRLPLGALLAVADLLGLEPALDRKRPRVGLAVRERDPAPGRRRRGRDVERGAVGQARVLGRVDALGAGWW